MSDGQCNKFADLFRKYRLRSEFETLSQFTDALSEMNFFYEESLFSHWQRGDRIPKDRQLLLAVVNLFYIKKGLTTLKEANDVFESAGQGYLTEEERKFIPENSNQIHAPFQVPRLQNNLIKREPYFSQAINLIKDQKIILIHGPVGIGKTTMAIELAHDLQSDYPDGVLWCRLDTSPLEDNLIFIASSLGFNLTNILGTGAKASYLRSVLSSKKILYIFDNVEENCQVNPLLPNSPHSAVIITSRHRLDDLMDNQQVISLVPLNSKECKELFEKLLGTTFVKKNLAYLKTIASLLGNLPLAIQVITKQLHLRNTTPEEVIRDLNYHHLPLSELYYENTNLYNSLDISYQKIAKPLQRFAASLAIFAGKDFSFEITAAINNTSELTARKNLDTLVEISLVEHSTACRYRLHPVIKQFLASKIIDWSKLTSDSLLYYQKFHQKNKNDKELYRKIFSEKDTLFNLLLTGYDNKEYSSLCQICKWFLPFLFHNSQREQFVKLLGLAYNAAQNNRDENSLILFSIREYNWLYHHWKGDLDTANKYTNKGLKLAQKLNNHYYIAYAQERLCKTCIALLDTTSAKRNAHDALIYFKSIRNYFHISNLYRYLSEIYIYQKDLKKGKKYLLKGLVMLKKIDDKSVINIYESVIYALLASLNLVNNQTTTALKQYKKSLYLQETSFHYTNYRLWIYLGLGLIYENQKELFEARKYFRLAEDVRLYFREKNNYGKTNNAFEITQGLLARSPLFNQSRILDTLFKR